MIIRNKHKEIEEVERMDEERFWEISTGTVTFFLTALALIVGVITFLSFYDGMKVKNQEEIATYISKMNQFLTSSNQYSDSVEIALKNGTALEFTKDDDQEFRTLVARATQLSVPTKWEEHREAAVELISARYMLFYQYQQNFRFGEKDMDEKFAELDSLEKVEKEVLLTSFDASGITYRETEEGKITFSIKTY
ncbi:hypothetical protein LG307_04170 [Sutcliffiella horikoshii]|uniref:hypothetical protein n=1 Tax=Sutcliffiella horikoshii TaxID=79883 RepID=UPI00384DC517